MKELIIIQLLIIAISACIVGLVLVDVTINTKYNGVDWVIQREIRIAKKLRITYWCGIGIGLVSIFVLHNLI